MYDSLNMLHKAYIEPKHLIVFVHGFTGGNKTFCNKDRHFYSFLESDILNICDIGEFTYHSRLFNFRMIKKIASIIPIIGKKSSAQYNVDLRKYSELLETHYYNNAEKYFSINVICHSMGGLIGKDFICSVEKKEQKVPGFYISLATPHRGVSEAKLLALLNNIQIASMEPFSSFIDSTTKEWAVIGPKVKRRYYCATHDEIVDDRSACPADDSKFLVRVEGSHTTLVKPVSKSCALMKSINSIVATFLGLTEKRRHYAAAKPGVNDVLFYAYKQELKDFYYIRKADQEISQLLLESNVWISGESGTGKTNIIQHFLVSNEAHCFNFDMSPCAANSTSSDLLSVIYYSLRSQLERCGIYGLTPDDGNIPYGTRISDLFCQIKAGSNIYIYIDELHVVDVETFEAFIDDMTSLISLHKSRVESSENMRVIVSTIANPLACDGVRFKAKHRSLFTCYNMRRWDRDEILGLLWLIQKSLELNLGTRDREKLVLAADGSPRRLKMMIKSFVTTNSVDSAIADVMSEGLR